MLVCMVLQYFPPYRLIVDFTRLRVGEEEGMISDPRSKQIHAYKLYSLPLVVSSRRIFHTSTY